MQLFKKYWYVFGLILLFIFHFVNNYIIINNNDMPFVGDAFYKYKQSVELFRTVFNIRSKADFSSLIHTFGDPNYPPLYQFAILPLYAIFGVSREVGSMSNIFFLIILIWSIFLIGREFSNECGGLFSAFILTTYPHVFAMSRWYMPDFASLAMVSLSIFLLIRSNNFLNRKYSILFSLAAAGAVLVRLASIYFLIAPVTLCILQLKPWQARESKGCSGIRAAIFNLALSFFIFLALFLPWVYLTKMQYLKVCKDFGVLTPALAKFPEGFKWLFNHSFLNVQLHWFYAFVFFFSLIILVWKRSKRLILLLVWYIVPLLILSSIIISSPCERFTLPGLGGIALISGLGIINIPMPNTKKFLIAFICFMGLIQYFFVSYSPLAGKMYPGMRIRNIKELVERHEETCICHVGLFQAKKCNWEADRIISLIMKNYTENSFKRVLIIYSSFSFFGSLSEQILNHDLPIVLYWGPDMDTRPNPSNINIEEINEIASIIEQSDYVLTYDRRVVPHDICMLPDKMFEIFEENKENFRIIEKLSMPDGNILHIYKKTG